MGNKVYHLHNWSMSDFVSNDPYRAPEHNKFRALVGYRDDEDRMVRTSAIVEIDGRTIRTYSGSIYFLEDINPEYLEWMNANGFVYDHELPIADKRKKG